MLTPLVRTMAMSLTGNPVMVSASPRKVNAGFFWREFFPPYLPQRRHTYT
jgi:hypothetical protein